MNEGAVMPLNSRVRQKGILFKIDSCLFVAFLLSCILLNLSLLTPVDAFAKVYVWKDHLGRTHLTDKPPPEETVSKPKRNYQEVHEDSMDLRATDQDITRIVDAVETAFRKNDMERLMQVYSVPGSDPNNAEERTAKVALQSSLELFLGAFGLAGNFTALPADQFPSHMVHDDSMPDGCAPVYRGYSFPFDSNGATGLVYLTICGSGKEARLVSFNYDLKNPTPAQQQEFEKITRKTLQLISGQTPAAQPQQAQPATKNKVQTPQKSAPPRATPPAAGQHQAQQQAQAPQNLPSMPQIQQQPGAGAFPMGQLPLPINPLDFMQAASMFTGMALLLQASFSLLCYFFMSLCIYLIARKTDTKGAWLAWVPILQIFPLIESAGIAWWWGLVLYLVPIPLMFIPLVNIIGMVVWFFVLLIFFVVVWMRICERLGMNKWLGLVMLLPVFNMVLLALLAFITESQGPPVPVKSIVGRTVLAFVLSALVVCGGLYLYVMPLMQDVLDQAAKMQQFATSGMQQHMSATTLPQSKNTPQNSQTPKKAKAAQPAAVLDNGYYEALFKKSPPDFSDNSFEAGRPVSCVGPACIMLSTFWDQQDPHVWLKVRIPDIPYMTMYDSSTMAISDVIDGSGKNVYDSKSSFESDHFLTLRFMGHSGGYLEAIRDVHLLAGTKDNSLKKVQGDLKFLFPMNVRSADFSARDSGQTKKVAGLEVTLGEIQGNTVKLRITGDIHRYIGVKAFDGSGNQLETGGSSSMTSDNTKNGSYSFQGNVSSLKVFVAEKLLPKNYTFTLEKKD